MDEKITISIIVPVYNAAAHLEKCVGSILGQTKNNFELILVDDGSTDGSPALCDSFSRDARVRVIHTPNGGPGEARNCGIRYAKGEFIGFVDADDYISKDMFKTLYDAVVSSGSDMAFCDYVVETKTGDVEVLSDPAGDRIYSSEEIKELMLPYFFGYSDSEISRYKEFFPFADYSSYIWLCLYKTSLIKEHNVHFHSQGKYYNEDHLFNLKSVFNARRVAHVAKFLYYYRDCDDSLTKRYNPDYLIAKLNRYDYLRNFINVNGCDASFQRRLGNKICIEAINIINYYVNSGISIKEKYAKICKTVNAPAIKEALEKLNLKSVPFSKLSVFLHFEKQRAGFVLLVLSEAYRLIRR